MGDEWGKVLYKHFGLPERVVERTNKQTTLAFAPVDVHPLGTNVAKAEEPKKSAPEVTAGQKRLRKVDTSGMTKLTQMFAKKPKKTE